jgi:hypothetical protein
LIHHVRVRLSDLHFIPYTLPAETVPAG